MKIFTVHDNASNTYINPFSMNTSRDAIDGFKAVSNDENTPYNKHPSDFTLCQIGEFDPRTGTLKPIEIKKLTRAVDLIETKITMSEKPNGDYTVDSIKAKSL